MYFVEITGDKITAKGEGSFKTEEQMQVSGDIYAALTSLPAEYVMDAGEIISVLPLSNVTPPEQEPEEKSLEERIVELEQVVADLTLLQLEVISNG